jgi:hypothetical protein
VAPLSPSSCSLSLHLYNKINCKVRMYSGTDQNCLIGWNHLRRLVRMRIQQAQEDTHIVFGLVRNFGGSWNSGTDCLFLPVLETICSETIFFQAGSFTLSTVIHFFLPFVEKFLILFLSGVAEFLCCTLHDLWYFLKLLSTLRWSQKQLLVTFEIRCPYVTRVR